MTALLLDLWEDLREKRLWPVAVGLLAAIAAIPLVLFKPVSQPAGARTAPPATSAEPALPVVAVDTGPVEGSKLEAFASKNPFKSLADLASSSTQSGSQTGSTHASSPAPTTPSAGGAGGSSSQTSAGGGSPAPQTTTQPQPSQPRWFQPSIDVKFGLAGQLRTIKGMKPITLLPNKTQPVVAFLGVADSGKSAVFFVTNPTYLAQGQGSCNAPGMACRFVTLTASHSSETFKTQDGIRVYKLELISIGRAPLNTSQTSANSPGLAPAQANGGVIPALVPVSQMSADTGG